jgi:hypothetical protein
MLPLRRFFYDPVEWEEEVSLYNDPVLVQTLPELLLADNNAAGLVRSSSGYVFPPFIVLERGITLKEWCERERGYGEVLTMVECLSRLLDVLHRSGRVHRDLKPLNVLYLLQSTQWKLLDLGIVANVGAHRRHARV